MTIPSGWVTARLEEIADVRLGKMLSDKARVSGLIERPYLRNENVRWWTIDTSSMKTMGFKQEETERYSVRTGDLLVCEGGEPGRCAVYKGADGEYMYQKALHRVRTQKAMAADLLQYWLRHLADSGALTQRIAQTTIGHLPLERFVAIELPIPPRQEQNRIVSTIEQHLSDIDAGVAAVERALANLKRYRASVLKAACEGRLVPTEAELARKEKRAYEPAAVLLQRIAKERRARWEASQLTKMKAKGQPPKDDGWKAKQENTKAPEVSNLPVLPPGWCWATMPQLGELNRGKSRHRPRNDPALLGGPYPFVQTGEVKRSNGFIYSFDATYSEFGLSQSRLWPAGTLCITIAANIAETGILKIDACFPDSVVGFLNINEPLLTRYVELFLRTAKENLVRYAPATAQKNINLDTLSSTAVALPPQAEQHRIVAEVDRLLSTADETEQTLRAQLARAVRLRQAVLKRAFEGKLVPQDPRDEPASALLARLRAAPPPEKKRAARARAH